MYYRFKDQYLHPNARGTGSAVRISLYPASVTSDGFRCPGSLFVEIAPQLTIPSADGVYTAVNFDWTRSISFSLHRDDLAHMIQVLRGMEESIDDGKGLFYRGQTSNKIVKFSHQIEPRPGYTIHASEKYASGDMKSYSFSFTTNEAVALCLAMEQSMMYVCFGIPEVFNW